MNCKPSFEEFVTLWQEMSEEERQEVVKLCVDQAHVWAVVVAPIAAAVLTEFSKQGFVFPFWSPDISK